MQQLFVQKGCMRLLSLPVWEEWIEIKAQEDDKSVGGIHGSPPIREERIEMNPIMLKPVIVRSLLIQGK